MSEEQQCHLQLIPNRDAPETLKRLDIHGPRAEVSGAGDAFLAQHVQDIGNPRLISTVVSPYADTTQTVAHLSSVPYTIKMRCTSVQMPDPSAPLPTPSGHEGKNGPTRLP